MYFGSRIQTVLRSLSVVVLAMVVLALIFFGHLKKLLCNVMLCITYYEPICFSVAS